MLLDNTVYFGVGFAHRLGVPLLLTCRDDHYRSQIDNSRVHFDLEQFKISFWSPNKSGGIDWPASMNPTDRLAKLIEPTLDIHNIKL